jgi:hypothetical protein
MRHAPTNHEAWGSGNFAKRKYSRGEGVRVLGNKSQEWGLATKQARLTQTDTNKEYTVANRSQPTGTQQAGRQAERIVSDKTITI